MCGIAGLYQRNEGVDLGRLQRMSRLLRHRGPDDEGILLLDHRAGEWMTLGGADTPSAVFASRAKTLVSSRCAIIRIALPGLELHWTGTRRSPLLR